jgi:hypothetical protein
MATKQPTTTAEYRTLESEAAFQTWVIAYARQQGWLVAHLRDSRGQDATGLPDLVLARRGLVVLAELKTETGKTTPTQDAWLAASGNHLWRPSMRDKIAAMLAYEAGSRREYSCVIGRLTRRKD